MKKITTLIFLSFYAIGFSQNKSQDQNKEIKAPTGIFARASQLPAAFYNSSWTVVGERTDGVGEMSMNAIDPSNFTIPNTAISRAPESTRTTVVYDNGPHINMPGNPDLSVLEYTTLGMSTVGAGIANHKGQSVADDFELVAETEITSISVYAYETDASSTTINGMFVTIWDGDPSDGVSSVIWGDDTTNVFGSVEDSDVYRVAEFDLLGRDRLLQKVNADISGLTLDAGTYWLQYSLAGTLSSVPYQIPIVILGEDTTGDALLSSSSGWSPWVDLGTGTPQGIPFQIYGTATGGTTGDPCNYQHASSTGDANGGGGSSLDSDYKSAADFVVEGEDFVLNKIEVPFLTYAPEDVPITAQVVYYEDDAGLPGNEIGSETVVPTIVSSGPWLNPVAYEFKTELDLTPFTFYGDAHNDTRYWIEISMGTATNQATVFWTYTEGDGLEGEPMAQYNAADGFWSIPEPTREAIYNFIGECDPLSVADNTLSGFSYYPNPTSGLLSLNSVKNIDSVSIFNLLGQKVMDVTIGATTSEVNLSALNAGTYIMQVSVEGQTGTYRVLRN